MKEQLISFETAKLAKEKGFRLQSNPFGYITKFYNHNTKTLLAYGRTGRTDLSKAYYAPSQSLIQKWLREVHGIHIDVRCDLNGGYYTYVMMTKGETLYSNIKTYDIYEEALEVGLQEALKLIELY